MRELEICERCKCCEVVPEECGNCDDGFIGHECGEDCCNCEYPEDNVLCGVCGGRGFFPMCIGRCDDEGKHVKRESLSSTITGEQGFTSTKKELERP